jgi:hypothetical protein
MGGSSLPPTSSAPSTAQPSSFKNPFSTIDITQDPVRAAALQWAASSSRNEAPPSYNSSMSSNTQPRQNWDQSFVNETSSKGVNPAHHDPNNPFQ